VSPKFPESGQGLGGIDTDFLLATNYTLCFGTNCASNVELGTRYAIVVVGPPSTQAAIAAQAIAWEGQSDKQFIPPGFNCHVGCVFAVNNLVHMATGNWLGGPATDNTDQVKGSGSVTPIAQGDAIPGDLIIVDSVINLKDSHIGICLSDKCKTMISNASHNCTFTFKNQYFDYPGSPYAGGKRSFWRVNP